MPPHTTSQRHDTGSLPDDRLAGPRCLTWALLAATLHLGILIAYLWL